MFATINHMDDEFRLKKLEKLVEENNRMLHKMRRAQIIGGVLRVLYWVIIIGFAVGAFYFVQPYLDGIYSTYSGIQNGVQTSRENIPSLPNLGGLLDSFGE